VIKLQGNSLWMPHTFLNRAVEAHMQRMFSGGYRCALLAEVDDMVIADPNVYPGGLAELLRAFAASSAQYHRTVGYELAHVSEGVDPEPAMNWSKPILQQRTFWGRHVLFDKPYLTKVPINYTHGFHSTSSPPPEAIEALPSMRLVHLHHADRLVLRRARGSQARRVPQARHGSAGAAARLRQASRQKLCCPPESWRHLHVGPRAQEGRAGAGCARPSD